MPFGWHTRGSVNARLQAAPQLPGVRPALNRADDRDTAYAPRHTRYIAEMLDGEDGARLQLLAARAAYPEVAPALEEIEGLLQDGGRRISKDAPGADAGVPREELLAAVRRVIEDLDMTGERDVFLWIRGGDPAMTESIEGARAKLDAVVERWR